MLAEPNQVNYQNDTDGDLLYYNYPEFNLGTNCECLVHKKTCSYICVNVGVGQGEAIF